MDWSEIILLLLLGILLVFAILTFAWELLKFLGKRIDRIDSLRIRIERFVVEKIFGAKPSN